MTPVQYANWAERWTNDIYKIARRRGVRHGRILSDGELRLRAFRRTFLNRRDENDAKIEAAAANVRLYAARCEALTVALRRIADEQNPRAAMSFKDAIAISQAALADLERVLS